MLINPSVAAVLFQEIKKFQEQINTWGGLFSNKMIRCFELCAIVTISVIFSGVTRKYIESGQAKTRSY